MAYALRPASDPRVAFLREAGRPLMFLGIAVGITACTLALALRIALGDTLDWQQLGAMAGAIAIALKHQDDKSVEARHEMQLEAQLQGSPPRGAALSPG